MKKNDIIIHFDWFELFEEAELSEEEEAQMVFAAINYVRLDEIPKFNDRALKAVWKIVKERVDSDLGKYEQRAAANRKNGKKGGRPKAHKEEEENPLGYLGFDEKPKKPDMCSVLPVTCIPYSDVCSVLPDAPDGAGDTHTRESVRAFFRDNGFKSDPDKFIDYNIGKGNEAIFKSPKRWQAVARNWEKNEKPPPATTSINRTDSNYAEIEKRIFNQ